MKSGIYVLSGTDAVGTVVSKVGLSVDVLARHAQHNKDGYAGITDWELHNWYPVDEGLLSSAERAVHDMLKEFNVSYYSLNGSTTREAFACHPEMAWGCTLQALSPMRGLADEAVHFDHACRPSNQPGEMKGYIVATLTNEVRMICAFVMYHEGEHHAYYTDSCETPMLSHERLSVVIGSLLAHTAAGGDVAKLGYTACRDEALIAKGDFETIMNFSMNDAGQPVMHGKPELLGEDMDSSIFTKVDEEQKQPTAIQPAARPNSKVAAFWVLGLCGALVFGALAVS